MPVCGDCHERIHFGDLWRLDPKKVGNRAIHFFEKFEEAGHLDVIITDLDLDYSSDE